MLESKIENYLRKRIRELKGEYRKVRWIGRRGAPDDLVWIPGWRTGRFAEAKRPGEPLDDHQYREHQRLWRMGFGVVKLDSIEDVDRLLRV